MKADNHGRCFKAWQRGWLLAECVMISWLIAACATPDETPATLTAALPTEAAITLEPTGTATVPPSPFLTEAYGSAHVEFDRLTLPDDILGRDYEPDCTLPCWFGLTPGQSTLTEVEGTIRQVLYPGYSASFVPLQTNSSVLIDYFTAVAEFPLLTFGFYADAQSQTLLGIWIAIDNNEYLADPGNLSPGAFLASYGAPDEMLVRVSYWEFLGTAGVELRMTYDERLRTYHAMNTQVHGDLIQVCLDDPEILAVIDIGREIDPIPPVDDYESFSSVFGASIEEVLARVSEGQACFTTAIPG